MFTVVHEVIHPELNLAGNSVWGTEEELLVRFLTYDLAKQIGASEEALNYLQVVRGNQILRIEGQKGSRESKTRLYDRVQRARTRILDNIAARRRTLEKEARVKIRRSQKLNSNGGLVSF